MKRCELLTTNCACCCIIPGSISLDLMSPDCTPGIYAKIDDVTAYKTVDGIWHLHQRHARTGGRFPKIIFFKKDLPPPDSSPLAEDEILQLEEVVSTTFVEDFPVTTIDNLNSEILSAVMANEMIMESDREFIERDKRLNATP